MGRPDTEMNGRSHLQALVLWFHHRRKVINAWAVRGLSFYFGYRILDHEIFGKETAEPLLIFLGLWLCGIAPASFFDGIRKVGSVTDEVKEQVEKVAPSPPKPELPSGDDA